MNTDEENLFLSVFICVYLWTIYLHLILIEYSEVRAVMNRRPLLFPPKHRFAGVSGTRIFPSSFPSGEKTCTPSPALDQMRPRSSQRIPSGMPLSITQK